MKIKSPVLKKRNARHTRRVCDPVVMPGVLFWADQIHAVVRKDEQHENFWWCRGMEDCGGQWMFDENTIINRRV